MGASNHPADMAAKLERRRLRDRARAALAAAPLEVGNPRRFESGAAAGRNLTPKNTEQNAGSPREPFLRPRAPSSSGFPVAWGSFSIRGSVLWVEARKARRSLRAQYPWATRTRESRDAVSVAGEWRALRIVTLRGLGVEGWATPRRAQAFSRHEMAALARLESLGTRSVAGPGYAEPMMLGADLAKQWQAMRVARGEL